jgi:hypothetical protein
MKNNSGQRRVRPEEPIVNLTATSSDLQKKAAIRFLPKPPWLVKASF